MATLSLKNVVEFQNKLLGWFKTKRRKFPWRKKGLTNYQLIIAEILLQRTKAETVAKYYEGFIRDFPNWQALVRTDVSQIENALRPLGLYKQRAARLSRLALEMVHRNGKIPASREELEQMPFMGQYIVNASLLLIHGQRVPLIDVNMARVFERYYKEREMSDIRYDPYLQKLAFRYADHPWSKELNWAILDFAALVCRARDPRCEECMLCDKCRYFLKTRELK